MTPLLVEHYCLYCCAELGMTVTLPMQCPNCNTTLENDQQICTVNHDPSFTCPDCGLISYHRLDIKNRYCGNCHQFKR